MNHADLFTGIGGFSLAAEWMGWNNIFQVEKDKRCQKLLEQNFPNVQRFKDIKEFDGAQFRGAIDVLSGGPPCQPTSIAGKRKGTNDDRWLWPEAIRIFGEVRPSVGVFENPDDLLTLEDGEPFERICSAMENFGYKVETYGIPAACVGAWDERDRIWIIAYNDNFHVEGELDNRRNPSEAKRSKTSNGKERQTLDLQRLWDEPCSEVETDAYINLSGLQGSACTEFRSISETHAAFKGRELGGTFTEIGSYWETEPGVVRMVHGLPNRVDRIKELGNAIKPQIAFEIFKVIQEIYDL